jgi:hypothetical protein
MNLPKIEQPIIRIKQPSTGKRIKFRPFLVKEEKILLMAQQSGRRDEVIHAIFQVINNCLVDDLDLRTVPTFDFDFFFLKLRAASVDNIISLSYTEPGDQEQTHQVQIDLDKIELVVPPMNETLIIQNFTVELQYPTIGSFLDITDRIVDAIIEDGKFVTFSDDMIAACIKSIRDSETVYDEYTLQELVQWVDTLPPSIYGNLKNFFDSIPEITHIVKYKTKDEVEQEVVLRGLEDFFTLP